YQSLERVEFFFLGIDVGDLECQVRPIESRNHVPRVFEPELLTDVGSDALGRGCRQSNDLRFMKPIDRLFEPQVIRSEIVSPMRNAVRFVDCEQSDSHRGYRIHKRLATKTFRSDIDDLVFAAANLTQSLVCLRVTERAVDKSRGDSASR